MNAFLWIDYELSPNFEHYSDQENLFRGLLKPLGLQEEGSGGAIDSGWRDISFMVPATTNIDALLEILKTELGFTFHVIFDTDLDEEIGQPLGCVAMAREDGDILPSCYWERDLEAAHGYITALTDHAPWMGPEKLFLWTSALLLEERSASVTHQPKLRCLAAAACQLLGRWQQIHALRFALVDLALSTIHGFDFAGIDDFKAYLQQRYNSLD